MTAHHQIDWLAEFGSRATHPPLPRARKRDPETSHAAAARAESFIASHESKIFGWLLAHPEGQTYRETAAGTKLEPVAVARRLKGMRDSAGVYADGERNRMTVWKVRR